MKTLRPVLHIFLLFIPRYHVLHSLAEVRWSFKRETNQMLLSALWLWISQSCHLCASADTQMSKSLLFLFTSEGQNTRTEKHQARKNK